MEAVKVERFYLGCLAHASYMIGSDGAAAVIVLSDTRAAASTALSSPIWPATANAISEMYAAMDRLR